MSETYRVTSFRFADGVRLRPIPEWAGCLVYLAQSRRILFLNVTTWLAALCANGSTHIAGRERFTIETADRCDGEQAGRAFDAAVALCCREGVLALDRIGSISSQPSRGRS